MTLEPIKLKSEGMLEVSIDDVTVSVDLYKVNNDLFEIGCRFDKKPINEYQRAVVEYLATLGLPSVPQQTADAFVTAVTERVAAVKNRKAGGPTPGSPASTAQAS